MNLSAHQELTIPARKARGLLAHPERLLEAAGYTPRPLPGGGHDLEIRLRGRMRSLRLDPPDLSLPDRIRQTVRSPRFVLCAEFGLSDLTRPGGGRREETGRAAGGRSGVCLLLLHLEIRPVGLSGRLMMPALLLARRKIESGLRRGLTRLATLLSQA